MTAPSSRLSGLSPEQLQKLIDTLRSKAPAAATPPAGQTIGPRPRDGSPLPLSFPQERLWLLDRLDPGSPAFNLAVDVELDGELDPAALAGALAEVVRRHESLRTTFAAVDGVPRQRIDPAPRAGLPLVDLAALSASAAESEARRHQTLQLARRFDLERGPLLAPLLVRLAPGRHWFLLAMHHAIIDGWSITILVRELAALYEAGVRRLPSPLPEPRLQYADYAVWQRAAFGEASRELDYWARRLGGEVSLLELPTDRPRPAVQTFRGGRAVRRLDAELSDRLRAFGRGQGASLFMVLLAAVEAVFQRWSGQDDMLLGTPIAGRRRVEIEELIGIFLNTLVLRTDLSGSPTFRELVARVREVTLEAYAHQDVPFEAVLARLQPDRDLSRTPFFQVLFNMVNLPVIEARLPGLTLRELAPIQVPSKFDMTFYASESGASILIDLVYNADLFDAARMEELLDQIGLLLTGALEWPGEPVGSLPLLTPRVKSIPSDADEPSELAWEGAVWERSAEHARREPGRTAVVDAAGAWTRGELEAAAGEVREALRAAGIGPEDVVAVWASRSAPLVAVLLGIWKAGAAFLILDPAYPPAHLASRLRGVPPRGWIEIAAAGAVPAEIAGLLAAAPPVCRLRLGAAPVSAALVSAAPPGADAPAVPDGLAYVAFTSGSTGGPKAIAGTHRPLSHFLDWHARRFGIGPGDRCSALSGLSHDPLLRDLFTPLWTGATLFLPDEAALGSGRALAAWMRRAGITVTHLTPALAQLLDAAEEPVDTLRLACFGGDRLAVRDAEGLRRLAPGVSCISYYGATETPQGMGWAEVPRHGETVPLGRGIPGVQLLVLDRSGNLAGISELGEICVRTPYLARGYLRRPDLTAERFIPNPLADRTDRSDRTDRPDRTDRSDRLYRTGDLGRYLPDGQVAFAGRADRQVKVRGFRIEPGEVEAALLEHPDVREAAVVLREDGGEPCLAAYVAGPPGVADGLRDFLRERLPQPWIPAVFVELAALPLTPNRKLDRAALPAPDRTAHGGETAAPRTLLEELLAGIWAEVLGVERVGIEDDFFALGGHSLLAAQVAARIHRTLGVEPPLRTLFAAPTVASLAARMETLLREGGGGFQAPPLRRVPRDGDPPLSFAQERLWFLDRLEPGSPAYNLPAAVRLSGPLEPALLAAALTAAAGRHESLRTTFGLRQGRPVQVIHPPRPVPLPVVDLSALSASARAGEARALGDAEAQRPFDLGDMSGGSLLRALLIRLEETEHLLVLTLHHIVADGWSLGVLVREVAALYEAARTGRPSPLPALPVQYADFAVWQRSWLTAGVIDGLLAHWRERLAGAPARVELPTDRPRPPVQRFHGARLRLDLPEPLVRGLRQAGRREGATLFTTLLAAFACVLSRSGGGVDLPVGTPMAGRNRVETEGMIGLLLNTAVLRADLAGDPSFRVLLARLREVTLDAWAHQDLPFGRLVEALVPERDLSHSPLFQVMLVLQNAPLPPAAVSSGPGGGLAVAPLDLEETAAKLDLILNLAEAGGALTGSWRFNRDLFDPATAARMLGHLETLLAAAAADPGLRLSELPLLGEAERAQLAAWNRTAVAWPLDLGLHQRIEAQVERTPGAVAVSCEGEELTYRELDARAGRLASRLRDLGAGPDVPVGICVERSLEMVVGLLAILKAGGAYVPLDPAYPAERLAWMLEDADVPVLLTRGELAGRLPTGARAVLVDLEDFKDFKDTKDSVSPESLQSFDLSPDNLAYVIYTSGSTGRPKGAMNTHRGITNRLLWMQEAFGLGPGDRVLQKTPLSFDVSVWELFWPLLTGAQMVLARPGAHGDPAYLVETIRGAGITTIHFVPSMLQVFAEAPGVERCRSLRRIVASGEALPAELARRLAERLPVPLYNLYGPTEAAVDVTCWACGPADERSVPIGRPIANTEVHLLDRGFQPVPVGVPGEIFLGGVNLARGYLRRPDLTAERFVPNPFADRTDRSDRLYRTGDLGRRRADGAVEFLGRLDHQVKVRGVRIELGEIEAALLAHPAVREAVVLAREERGGRAVRDLRLAAFVVPREGRRPAPEELSGFLAGRLPEAMLPSPVTVLDALPLNPSGKVDRAALARLEAAPAPRPAALPRTPVERFLAGLFREVLRLPAGREIGLHDSFFALGGNSIDAAVLVNRMQEELAEIVHVVVLFEAPTLAGLAAYLVREHPAAVSRLWSAAPAVRGTAAAGRRIDAARVAEMRSLIPPPAPERDGSAARNPPAVFVVSPPRSGSTLLRVMLGGNPGLFAPPELELLPYNTLAERRAAFPGADAFRLEGAPRALMQLRGCGPDEAKAAVEELAARGTTTAGFYRLLQDETGGRLLVDKTPSYTFHAGVLRRAERIFDRPIYVHLIRHPHGMIHSFEEAKLDQVFLRGRHPFTRRELAELLWVIGHQNAMELLREVPVERQIWIRFEDLVREPETTLRALCGFLGVDWHPAMARPYEDGAARMTDGLHAASRMLGDVKFHRHAGIDPGVADRWRDAVTEDFLGDATRETAVALGLPLEPPRRAPRGEADAWERIPRLPREPGRPLPLSFTQERLWFLHRLDPGSSAYNVPAALRLTGSLDRPALAWSLREIARRHEALRTRFAVADGRPAQTVDPEPRLDLPLVDLAALEPAAREAEAVRLAAAEAAAPFDLERGPVARATLVRLDRDDHAALLTMHHIVSDGWSLGIAIRELTVLYAARLRGEPSPLPEPEIQYADFAAWQRRWLAGERLERLLAGWRQRLAGAPAALDLPTDRPRPPVQTFRGSSAGFRLGTEAAAALRGVAGSGGDANGRDANGRDATPFMVLLAAFQALLHRHSGQEDLVIGSPTAGRVRRELEGVLGAFINTLPLRGDLAGDPTWRELLARTRDAAVASYALQDLPFEKLVEELQPPRDLARPPLFQVLLAQQNPRDGGLELPGLTLSPLAQEVVTAKLELVLSVADEPAGGYLEYNTDLFDRSTAERMLGHFETLLAGAAAGPDRRLSELPLLTAAERGQLARWNDTAAEVPAGCLHELVAAQAARTPEATAVSCGSSADGGASRLTYAELRARAGGLARQLRRLGVGPETLVGLAVERSPDLVAALLGILEAGGAYLPLDPSHPAERLSMVLEDARPRVLITGQALARGRFAGLPGRPEHTLLLDAPRAAVPGEGPPGTARTLPDNLAYVLFTSGSTGRPKGVAVTHRSLLNLLASMGRVPGLLAGGRLLAVTSLSFDIAGVEIWLPLLLGGCVELATHDEAADGRLLAARLAASGARTMQATPATWRMLLDTGWAGDPELAAVSTGEALPRGLAERLAGRTGALWNFYGPTETTIFSSLLRVGAEEAGSGAGAVSIGRPVANTALHLLDRRGFPVPVGVPGEIRIGGEGLARGYLGRPELTAERFVPDPFSAAGGRLYRTGDLARRRPDGALEFLGRLDDQVKIRGFRIEPGEVEAVLARHPAVAQAVVVAAGSADPLGDARLIAHVVARQPVETVELRAFAARLLPSHMVPAAFVEHAALPLTTTGKVDRKALARTAPAAGPAPAAATAPATPLEAKLAALWGEVLGVESVGPHDDFFALGGHSVFAAVLMHRVGEELGADLPLRALFATPTVAGLAAAVAARAAERGEGGALPDRLPRIVPDLAGRHLPFPLTDVQEAYWIGRNAGMELGAVATHIYFEIDSTGLDVDRFERALRRLIDRHGMLRAVVDSDGRQRILAEVPPYVIARLDLRAADDGNAGEALAAVRERMSHQVLPSDRWPLFEFAASLLPASDERQDRMRLHVSLDLLIGDAWSLRLLARDLGQLYELPESPLPALDVSFRDYVLAEAALRETAAWQRATDYWHGRLADFPPPPALPLAKSPSAVAAPRFVRRWGELPAPVWTRLKELAAGAGITASGALLAAWSEVLAAWGGGSRFTLNLTLFNRLPFHPQVDQLVGDFTSLTLLAVERRPGEPFAEEARRLQQRLWDDLDHRLVSGVRVLRELSRLRREPRTIMPVVFTSTLHQASRDEPAAEAGSGVQAERGFAISQTPQVWLDHQVSETAGALFWKWDAVEELFPAGLLDDMLAAYVRLLERLAAGEAAWREPVRGLLPAEQLRLIAEANATAAPVPAGLLHEPFLEQARRTPGAPAVITSSRTLTYGELDRLSLTLAHRLRQLGAGPNRLVAVVMHKGWEQVAAVLAVLRAGAAYLPVDARLPAERLRHLIVRGEVAIALTQPGLDGALDWPDGIERVVVEAQDGKDSKDGKDGDLENPAAAGDLAYVIFTSGSTGEPKGVMIDHRGALNTVIDVNRRFGAGPDDRVLALSSLSFDLSVWDVFGVLAAGGAVVVPDAGSERDPEHWAALAERERVTVWNTVPALLEMLVEHGAGRPGALAAPLRLVLLSGDWIPTRLPDRIRAAFPGARVISLGGATEASIWSILHPVGEVGAEQTSIPYGRAMANQSFHVLDEDLEPCPVWVPGHLWIGGIGLALGYWRDEEKTRASFRVHPQSGERLYRTGDLGRLLPDGDVELLGRDDTQVKVQGHRIELGEIEAALARHPAVAAAVVAAVGERSGPKRLVGYVVAQPAEAVSTGMARSAVVTDPLERLRFKLAHHGLRPDEGRPAVELRRPELSPERIEALYLRRRSYRRFLREPLPLDDLAGLLSCLLPVDVAGSPFPKHRYGSAGNLYPVQTYLHVKTGRVEGLAGGLYYHDPRGHRLVLVSTEDRLDAALWDPVNRPAFEEAAFAVFLIARLAAIAPLYGERSRHFAALEAGLMTQLLETAAPDHGIGLSQMGGLRFEAVRRRFALDESCELAHTLLGGRIDAAQTGLAAFAAEMAEQQALMRLLEQRPEGIAAAAVATPSPALRSDAELFTELREHLRTRLPEPLVPALWVRLDALPLSANGKVDRKGLPPPEAAPAETRPAAAWAPPETAIEQALAGIVAEVLGVPRVGLHDNFFDLGASSVHIVRVHNALRERLGTEIPIVEMFNNPSVSHLAHRLAPDTAAPDAGAPGAGTERNERLREGKDWRRQTLEKRRAAGGL